MEERVCVCVCDLAGSLIINLLMFTHVLAEGVLIVGQKVALAADALVVNFVDVSGQSFRTGRFIVA